MTTTTKPVCDGYDELIRRPLEQADQRSFALVNKLLENIPESPDSPFGFLIKVLCSVVISPREAPGHWRNILEHKRRLELKLCRPVTIRTACVDYYDQLGIDTPLSAPPALERKAAGVTAPLTGSARKTGDYPYQERLREEILRARRYKHALSVILFDVDLGGTAAQTADKALTIIMKLINKAVRTVDILARHADGRFLLMLPNTNKREALELAERLKNNICVRIGRIPELSEESIRMTIALGQSQQSDTAADFIRRLERLAERGACSAPADIRVLE
jgi:diguanylate cyclase (GGDEF)-like protein